MIPDNAINPFTPGFSSFPPAFVGRAGAEKEMLDFVRRVGHPNHPNEPMLIYGPRGNGKTALIAWLLRNRPRDVAVDVHAVAALEVNGFPQLAAALALDPDDATRTVHKTKGGPKFLSAERVRETSRPSAALNPAVLTKLLIDRCTAHPLALVVDEAQRLDPEIVDFFVTAATKVSASAPFALAFSGTPNVIGHLLRHGPTHPDRCLHVKLGRLDPAAAGAALTVPFERLDSPVGFDDDALEQAVEATGCYPYFVQEWGYALWAEARRAGSDRVTLETVDKARPTVHVKLSAYYQKYYKEIVDAGLHGQALAIADAYERNGFGNPLPVYAVEGELLAAMPDMPDTPDAGMTAALAAVERFKDIGFVWDSPTVADHLEAGIPSLMAYVRTRQRSLRRYRGLNR